MRLVYGEQMLGAHVPVAQLDKASDYESEDWGFKSLPGYGASLPWRNGQRIRLRIWGLRVRIPSGVSTFLASLLNFFFGVVPGAARVPACCPPHSRLYSSVGRASAS